MPFTLEMRGYHVVIISIIPLKNHRILKKQGRKRPLDKPKRMIERREREGERERKVQGEI